MSSPPVDPRDRPVRPEPDGPAILVGWAMMVAVLLLIWAVSYPVLAVLAVAVGGVLFLVGRRARWLMRCYAECERLTVTLGRHVRITVGQPRNCGSGRCEPS